MKLSFQWGSFKTRVARRVFVLFIICAIMPISVLGGLSYYQVERNLVNQHLLRLRQESRAVALSIYDRFQLLQQEVRFLSLVDPMQPGTVNPGAHFLTWKWEPATGERSGTEDPFSLRILEPGGDPAVVLQYHDAVRRRRLTAQIDTAFLWEARGRLPRDATVVITQTGGPVLFASEDAPEAEVMNRLEQDHWARNGEMDWQGPQGRFLAGYAALFLKPLMESRSWVVVIVTPANLALAPMSDFKVVFPALIVFSLGLVFMLGQYLIRRSTEPIQTLQEGTRRIAGGEFGYEVAIHSSDEFEDLGQSFNEMSRKLRESQALLVRAARMSTMGQMASGIVHEVKQPLSAIHGLVELVMLTETDADNIDSLETVMTAIQDLNTTLNRFQSFSREETPEMLPLDLNDVIQEVYRLLIIRLKKQHITCHRVLSHTLPLINGDRRGLQQVVSNLIINAMHALEEKPSDSRTLTLRTIAVDGKVVMEVSDNGGGIPDDIRDKIFDPFFTTKAGDKGTGIGMAIVENTVHQHGADIELHSQHGHGTTVRIIFTPPSMEDES